MKLTPNAPIDRLKYIAKTYAKQPWVVIDMIDIIAHTVGEDHWKHEIERAAQEADPQFYEDMRAASVMYGGSQVANHRYALTGQREMPPRYAEVAQALVKLVGEDVLDFDEPNDADGAFPWMATQLSKLAKLVQKDVHKSGQWGGVVEYDHAYRFFRQKGTVIGQWLKKTRPNLTQMDADDVEEALETFEVEHRRSTLKGEIVREWDDGWTIQKLTTKELLESEGEEMQHCVGSYYDSVRHGKAEIYSLRDPQNEPHVTIEVKNNRVVQVKGKQNDTTQPKYRERVDEWIRESNFETEPKHLKEILAAIDASGYDYDDDEARIWDAERWHEAFGRTGAVDWLSVLGPYDFDLAESLSGEDVTPAEWDGWLWTIQRKLGDSQNYNDIPRYKAIQRIAGWLAARAAVVEKQGDHGPQISMGFGERATGYPLNVATETSEFLERSPGSERYWRGTEPEFRHRVDESDRNDPRYPYLDEAARWWNNLDVFDANGLDEIEEWIEDGFSLDDALSWREQGFEPHSAVERSGEVPSSVGDQADANAWRAVGVGPKLAAELRDAGITHEDLAALTRVRTLGGKNASEIVQLVKQLVRNRRR